MARVAYLYTCEHCMIVSHTSRYNHSNTFSALHIHIFYDDFCVSILATLQPQRHTDRQMVYILCNSEHSFSIKNWYAKVVNR